MDYLTFALARTRIGRVLRWVPGLEATYTRHALQWADQPHRLCGVYASYEDALAATPASRPVGWNNEAAAAIWTDCIDPVRPSSYPVFFWLSRLLQPGTAIIDLGGSIGITYYGYQRFARLPRDASWTVIELPLIAAAGRRIAEGKAGRELFFGSEITSPEACDILLASGSLQYMRESVPGLLELRRKQPRWVLLNKVPFSGWGFWSLDNFGPAVAPTRVFTETAFLGYFTDRGYAVADRWLVPDIRSDIAFHPEARITYHGFCLGR